METFKLEVRGDHEIVITRLFDAPRKLVFEAWTRPELLRQRNKTRLTHALLHGSKEARNGHLQAGMEGGMIQSFKRPENLMRTPLLVGIGGNQSEA